MCSDCGEQEEMVTKETGRQLEKEIEKERGGGFVLYQKEMSSASSRRDSASGPLVRGRGEREKERVRERGGAVAVCVYGAFY